MRNPSFLASVAISLCACSSASFGVASDDRDGAIDTSTIGGNETSVDANGEASDGDTRPPGDVGADVVDDVFSETFGETIGETCPSPLATCAKRPPCATNTDDDPLHCGACGVACGHAEYCAKGACTCRPGFLKCPAGCVNDYAPSTCGKCDTACASGDQCDLGPTCNDLSGCAGGRTRCAEGGAFGCHDLMNDPEHCGACSTACAPDAVCVAGNCRTYTPAVKCTDESCCKTIMAVVAAKLCKGMKDQASLCVRGTACPTFP